MGDGLRQRKVKSSSSTTSTSPPPSSFDSLHKVSLACSMSGAYHHTNEPYQEEMIYKIYACSLEISNELCNTFLSVLFLDTGQAERDPIYPEVLNRYSFRCINELKLEDSTMIQDLSSTPLEVHEVMTYIKGITLIRLYQDRVLLI